VNVKRDILVEIVLKKISVKKMMIVVETLKELVMLALDRVNVLLHNLEKNANLKNFSNVMEKTLQNLVVT